MRGKRILYVSQNFLPVGTDLLGMEAKHGTAIVGILGTDIKDGLARGDIDGGQEDGLAASLTGPLHHGVAILCELFAVQVAMGVGEFQISN